MLGLPQGMSLPPVAPYKSYVNSPYPPSLYTPYNNIHHSPYNIPTAVPSPSASPRTSITPGAEMRRDKSPHIIGDNKGRSITPGSTGGSNSSMGPSPGQHHLHHHLSPSPHHYPHPTGMPHTAISLSNSSSISSNNSTSLRDQQSAHHQQQQQQQQQQQHAQGSSAIPPSVIPRIHSPRGGPSPSRERESFRYVLKFHIFKCVLLCVLGSVVHC